MTFEELLAACSSGKMPSVRVLKQIKFATSDVGRVVTIKDNGRHSGIGVKFPGHDNYDTWFHNSQDTDRRSNYMYELELIKP